MNRYRLDPVVAALSALLLCVGVWGLTTRAWVQEVDRLKFYWEVPRQETQPFLAKYGLDRHSRNLEEFFIREFFQGKREGVFLDVGANHYRDESNTYFLESQLGWRGVAVEPLTEFAADYATHRPRTQFIAAFAGDQDNGTVRFFVPQTPGRLLASMSKEFASREGGEAVATTVPTATLNTILEQAGITRLDFMSMDIELSEPLALKGLDLTRFGPSLICIEAQPEVRQAIIDHLTANGYRIIGKYLRADARNLYFAIGEIPDDPATRAVHADDH